MVESMRKDEDGDLDLGIRYEILGGGLRFVDRILGGGLDLGS